MKIKLNLNKPLKSPSLNTQCPICSCSYKSILLYYHLYISIVDLIFEEKMSTLNNRKCLYAIYL